MRKDDVRTETRLPFAVDYRLRAAPRYLLPPLSTPPPLPTVSPIVSSLGGISRGRGVRRTDRGRQPATRFPVAENHVRGIFERADHAMRPESRYLPASTPFT